MTRTGTPGRLVPFIPILLAVLLAAQQASPDALDVRLEKATKSLQKAARAANGTDPGRVSAYLQRAEEEAAAFESESGLAPIIASMGQSRDSSGTDLKAAMTALRSARSRLAALSRFTVPRESEVAYRKAESAAGDGDADGFRAGLDRMEAATLAPSLLACVRRSRDAIARARTKMVRNDMPGGRKEIAAAQAALQDLGDLGILSRGQYGLVMASELMRAGALLAAHDQLQRGMHELADLSPSAPAPARELVDKAHADAVEVWRRGNHHDPGDADRLAAASKSVEVARQQIAFPAPGAVSK